jgi:pyruvate/2-oxoglutarate dehydrogenase complex dihydrolipoamide dehydrogenase (E3) component
VRVVDYELLVIGGGAAGLSAARAGVGAGKRTALVERADLGGDCTHTGCVPSKSLIEAARRVHHARTGADYGFCADVTVDFAAVMRRVRRIVEEISSDESAAQLATEGIDVVRGTARFTDPHTLDVDGRRVTAERVVIATGGSALVPPIPGLDATPYLTNDTLFDLTTLPRRLVVLGGGPIGVEMAQAFARLGSDVTVVEGEARILPRDEPEVSDVVGAALERDGVTLRLGAKVTGVAKQARGVRLDLDSGAAVTGRHLLVAVGRRPRTASLDLERAGVATRKSGHVEVDDALRTTAKHVYAIGDCAAKYQFTHLADEQGRHAVANAFSWRQKDFDIVLPWVTFTDPEVAHVGMTEAEAFAAYGAKAQVSLLQMSHVDRARCAGETDGFVKVIVAPRRPIPSILAGRVVGATVVGTAAGELLGEFVLAMQTKAFAGRVAQTVHAYPTWSLANRQAVALFAGPAFYGEQARPARG